MVADEIKELADRVLVSTKEIGGLIRSVQERDPSIVRFATHVRNSVRT